MSRMCPWRLAEVPEAGERDQASCPDDDSQLPEQIIVPNPPLRSASGPANLIALIAIVGILYFMRDVCIPFILAILLSFVLSPVVSRLQKWHIPRVPAVFLVVGFMLILICMFGWLVGNQLVSLAEQLPQYQANVDTKFKSFQTSPGGVVDRLNHTLDFYTKEIESIGSQTPAQQSAAIQPQADNAAASTQATAPVAVRPQRSKVAAIVALMLSVLGPMTTFGIVTLLGLFMLIRQEDVRDRAIRLLGGGQLHLATQALDDAGRRVSRYLPFQLIVNASFGVSIGIGLALIGVPYSLMWGLMAACLRFVPYFGAPISAIAPLMMPVAATPGWTTVILTVILFAALELSIANVVEPWLYGSSAQISPLAIVVSAIFWFWLWGPIGLLLSTFQNPGRLGTTCRWLIHMTWEAINGGWGARARRFSRPRSHKVLALWHIYFASNQFHGLASSTTTPSAKMNPTLLFLAPLNKTKAESLHQSQKSITPVNVWWVVVGVVGLPLN
jgi:predicted PurR-regulated permease PerM